MPKKKTEGTTEGIAEAKTASTPKTSRGKKEETKSPPEVVKQPRYLGRDEVLMSEYGQIIMPDNDAETVDELTRLLAQRRENQIDIAQSKISGRILSDTLIAVEKVKGGYGRGILYHGDVKVIIPGENFSPREGLSVKVCNTFLSKLVNTRVDYIIDAYEKDDAGDIVVAAGNRRAAMKKKAEIWMTGTETQAPKINEGDIAQARVLSVEEEGYVLECGGVEAYIPERNTRLTQDQITLVKITAKTERDGVPSFRGEIMGHASEGLRATNIVLRSKYSGVISSITNDGVFVTLNGGVPAYCRYPADRSVRVGQKCSIIATSLSDRNRDLVLGRIVYVQEG